MAIEIDILTALRSRLITFAQTQSLPIAFTNRAFSTQAPGKYLRETFIPNIVSRPFIGSTAPQRHQGLYQVDLMWPRDKGETEARTLAGELADHFPTDFRLTSGTTSVRITRRPDVAGMLIEDTRTMIPVTISWESYA
jgi:hypothetical protein